MSRELWAAVDEHLIDMLGGLEDQLVDAARASLEAGLPDIGVSAMQGKLLRMLARAAGARRILEIGTLGGYSTIWLAGALPKDGLLVTIEQNRRFADIATANLARAGLHSIVDVRVGAALDLLPRMVADGEEPFDLTFVDADQVRNAEYLHWTARLSRPGSLIVVDNVVRAGQVADPESRLPPVLGTRAMFEAIASDCRLDATVVQTVGSKGHDGFAIIQVN
jgi:predicted O-methyltransferase YrrM